MKNERYIGDIIIGTWRIERKRVVMVFDFKVFTIYEEFIKIVSKTSLWRRIISTLNYTSE